MALGGSIECRTAVVDIQGFAFGPNEFIVKELAVRIGVQLNHYVFKPPKPYYVLNAKEKRTVRYSENRLHGLRYSRGNVEYSELRNILFAINVDRIFVKGHQKHRLLLEYQLEPEIVNLERLIWHPKIKPAMPACLNHYNGLFKCTINVVNILYHVIFGDNKQEY